MARRLAWLSLMEPYDVGIGDTVLERFATSTLAADSSGVWGPAGTIHGRIEEPFSIRASLLSSNRIADHAIPSVGDIVLLNPTGELDYLLDYSWTGRRIELRLGYADDSSMASFDDVAPLGVKWIGTAKQPRATKNKIVIPLRGIEDLFNIPLQQNTYNPGYEPYVIFDGVDNQIAHGDNLDRGTQGFHIGAAFRTTAAIHNAGIYGNNQFAGLFAGYGIGLGSGGAIRFDLSDGTNGAVNTHTPSGGYNSGERISVVVRVNRTTNLMTMFVKIGNGEWDQVDQDDISAVGSVDNATQLWAGRRGGGQWFDGEIERYGQRAGGDDSLTAGFQAIFDERFADDVDASGLDHYVPLTENIGTNAEDVSPNGFNGTLTGEVFPDNFWSGLHQGTPVLGGKPRPICVGRVHRARPVLVDPIKQIYQLHSRPIDDVIQVTEGGVALPFIETGGDIWTASGAPTSGNVTWQNTPEGAFMRLATPGGPDNLQSDLTFSAIGDAGSVNPDLYSYSMVYLRSQHMNGRVYSGSIQLGIGDTFVADAPLYTAGFYWRDEITLAEAMTEVFSTADFHWTVNGRFPFDVTQVGDPLIITYVQIRDVLGQIPDATIILDSPDTISGVARDGFEVASHVPHWKDLTIEFDKSDGWMPMSASLPGAPATRRALLAREWRSLGPPLLVQPQSILDAYLEGESKTIQTGIRFTSHAQDEAERRLAVYAIPRPIVQLERTANEWGLWIGDVVEVNGSRFGTDSGPKYIVLGIEDRTSKGVAGTRLWLYGGFAS